VRDGATTCLACVPRHRAARGERCVADIRYKIFD
jgi:hypothetical protein